jgi:hypothetical protein
VSISDQEISKRGCALDRPMARDETRNSGMDTVIRLVRA